MSETTATAQIGVIGMAVMGSNLARNFAHHGYRTAIFNRTYAKTADVIASFPEEGFIASEKLEDVVASLEKPRRMILMVKAGPATDATIDSLVPLLEPGDIVIDGGNSRYTDDQVHAEALSANGIGYIDAGVSGGVWGLTEGYALMVGGAATDVQAVQPVFDSLKPTGGGFVHAGPVGAGHFAKMVHNGIEYGMMQAYGEGYELLQAVDLIPDPDTVMASWQHGTVIRSWLLELLTLALSGDPGLAEIRGYAQDSGEGRWTIEAAIQHAVPLPVITAALFARFASRQPESPAMKVVAALRNQFGGHAVGTAGSDTAIPIS
jgi:6-phosphogluconate dehydrogenase